MPRKKPKALVKAESRNDPDAPPLPSTGLFLGQRRKGITMTEDQQQRAMDLSETQRRFLYAFCDSGTLAGASDGYRDPETGRPAVSIFTHDSWMERHPAYRALYQELRRSVDGQWEQQVIRKAMHGLEERTYKVDKDGDERLVGRKVREDGNLLRMIAGAKVPEFREKGDTNVQVIVQVVNE